jgi:hypothetical protein
MELRSIYSKALAIIILALMLVIAVIKYKADGVAFAIDKLPLRSCPNEGGGVPRILARYISITEDPGGHFGYPARYYANLLVIRLFYSAEYREKLVNKLPCGWRSLSYEVRIHDNYKS